MCEITFPLCMYFYSEHFWMEHVRTTTSTNGLMDCNGEWRQRGKRSGSSSIGNFFISQLSNKERKPSESTRCGLSVWLAQVTQVPSSCITKIVQAAAWKFYKNPGAAEYGAKWNSGMNRFRFPDLFSDRLSSIARAPLPLKTLGSLIENYIGVGSIELKTLGCFCWTS